jgi:hypothetical protein
LSRAYWNGFLKLSFVSCPVALYPATTAAERVSFRQVNRRTGHRLKHQLVDSITGEAVETHDKARAATTSARTGFCCWRTASLIRRAASARRLALSSLRNRRAPCLRPPQSGRPSPKRTTMPKKNRAPKRMSKRRSRKRTRLPSSRARSERGALIPRAFRALGDLPEWLRQYVEPAA